MQSLSLLSIVLVLGTVLSVTNQVDSAEVGGCVSNEACTDLCGFAGPGECVTGLKGKYCNCANCPQRSPSEVTYKLKVCTVEPMCQLRCPASSLSLSNGKLYSGHQCVHSTGLVCICFCLPTTPQSVIEVIKCPFPIKNDTTTTEATTSGL